MKLIVLGMLALACAPALGQDPAPKSVTDFQWSGEDMVILNRLPAFSGNPYTDSVSVGGRIDEPPRLTINYALARPLQITIRTLGPAIASRVKSKRYAITGIVSYEGVPSGSYLEMWSYFAPTTPGGPQGTYFSRTLADSGPMAKMEGTDDGRDFLLPFDATGATTQMERIEFNLHLTGPGTVHLWNVKLVQYPDSPQPPAASTAPAQPAPSEEGQVVLKLSQENAFQGVGPANGESGALALSSSPLLLWDIHDPKITSTHYAVTGEIRYEDVSSGELQLWSLYAPEAPGGPLNNFYTRTESDTGPLAKLKGSSDWRPFWLPFDGTGTTNTRLTRIGISLRLADRGKVYVRNVKLMQYPTGRFPASFAQSGMIPPPRGSSGEYALPEFSGDGASTPSPGNPAADDQLIVNVTPGADDAARYSTAGVYYSNLDLLGQVLAARKKANPNVGVIINADRHVAYASIRQLLDECAKAGVSPSFGTAPASSAAAASKNTAAELVIQIQNGKNGNKLSLGGVDYESPELHLKEIEKALTTQLAAAPGSAVVIKTDPNVDFNLITVLVDFSHESAAKSITVLTSDAKSATTAPSADKSAPGTSVATPQVPMSLDEIGAQVSQEEASALKAIWFCLGIVATAIALLLAGGCTFVVRRLRSRQKERELRRIASLDG